MTKETSKNYIVSPVTRSNIAKRRARQFLNHINQKELSSLILYKHFANKKIKSIKKKFTDVVQKQYPAINKIKFYQKKTMIGIFYFYVDYNATRITQDNEFSDTALTYAGTFIESSGFYNKYVIFTWHAVKRLLERSKEVLNYTNDDTSDLLAAIGNDVDADFQETFGSVTEENVEATLPVSHSIQYETFEVIYRITRLSNGAYAPTVVTIINKEWN